MSFKATVSILEPPSVCSAAFSVHDLEPAAYLLVGWRDTNAIKLLEPLDMRLGHGSSCWACR